MAIRRAKRGKGIDTYNAEASVAAALDRIVDSYAQRLRTAAKNSAILIRKKCITDWYSINNLKSGAAVANAVTGTAKFRRISNRKTIIEVTTYMDTDHLISLSSRYPSADRWISKHEDINSPWAPGLYVYTLRWETGALALPEISHFTGSGWVNPNFLYSSVGPLKQYTLSWLEEEMPYMIVDIMKGRNTNMGAGISSTGRDTGLANLNKHRKK